MTQTAAVSNENGAAIQAATATALDPWTHRSRNNALVASRGILRRANQLLVKLGTIRPPMRPMSSVSIHFVYLVNRSAPGMRSMPVHR